MSAPEVSGGFLAFVIVLPVAFIIGVALFTYAVVKRWRRDDSAPPDRMFYYDTEPGITLEERVKRIHEAREAAERGQLETRAPPPVYHPPPGYETEGSEMGDGTVGAAQTTATTAPTTAAAAAEGRGTHTEGL